MAKRKRLGPASLLSEGVAAEGPRAPYKPAPIAEVALDAASQAAFEEVSQALTEARTEGRLIQNLPLEEIVTDHLVRDRLHFEDEDMQALIQSLRTRGQQTPIEVVTLQNGQFGLISGWRRVEALRALGTGTVLALVRAPKSVSDAYVAMIEENEIRAGLSYYERARLAAEAVRIGVYPDRRQAVQALFANASASKRSKILNFVTIYDALDTVLKFPAAIPEKLGLKLSGLLEGSPDFAARLRDSLRKTPASEAATERAALERAMARAKAAPPTKPAGKQRGEEVTPGLYLQQGRGRLVIEGAPVNAALIEDLRQFLKTRR